MVSAFELRTPQPKESQRYATPTTFSTREEVKPTPTVEASPTTKTEEEDEPADNVIRFSGS